MFPWCGWYSNPAPTQVAAPPNKNEYIYLDTNPGWYQDPRKGFHPPGLVYTNGSQGTVWNGYYAGTQPVQATQGYYVNGQYVPLPAGTTYSPSPYYYPFSNQYTYNWSIPQPPYPNLPTTLHFSDQISQYYKSLQAQGNPPHGSCTWNPYSYLYRNLVPGAAPLATYATSYPYNPAGAYPNGTPHPAGCPADAIQAAQFAASTNASLAAMPKAPNYFVGGTPAELVAQQNLIMNQFGAAMGWMKPQPNSLYPYKPSDGQQFWCRETDGSWTLRTHEDIINGEVNPGHWERHATSGYFYWVRD